MTMSWKGATWTKPFLDSGIMMIANRNLLLRKITTTFLFQREGTSKADKPSNPNNCPLCVSICSHDGSCTLRDLCSIDRLHRNPIPEPQSAFHVHNPALAPVCTDHLGRIHLLPTPARVPVPEAQVLVDQRVLAGRSPRYPKRCKFHRVKTRTMLPVHEMRSH